MALRFEVIRFITDLRFNLQTASEPVPIYGHLPLRY